MRKWLPSADPLRQDIYTGASNAIPTPTGSYRNAPGFLGEGSAVSSPGTMRNAFQGYIPAGTPIRVVGTTTKLYMLSGTTFTDRSKGGGYTNTATHWSFALYGNYLIATNGVDAPQVRDASGSSAFADLGGTPPTTAKYVVTQSNAVLFFNTNSGGQYWAASDVGNHANYTSGEAASGPINHRPGPITAAVAFGNEVLVFKSNSMFRMRYVGGVVKWTVEMISDVYGAAGPGSVAVCGNLVCVMDASGAYLFDGASFHRIDSGIKDYFKQNNANPVAAQYFESQESVWFHVASFAVLTYSIPTDAWGTLVPRENAGDITASIRMMIGDGQPDEMTAIFIDPGLSTPLYMGYPFDEDGGAPNLDLALDGSLTTGWFGEFDKTTFISRVTPAFQPPQGSVGNKLAKPGTADITLSVTYADQPEDSGTTDSAVSASSRKRFDFTKSAPWMTFTLNFTNTPWDLVDILVTQKKTAGVN